MTREQLILQLQGEYAQRREDNLHRYEQRVEEACAQCAGLRPLLNARHAALMAGIRGALYPKQKDPDGNAGLPNAMADYNERIAALMKQSGLDPALLQPVYTCASCKDEGYLYDPSRHMCDCFADELNRRLLDELGLQPNASFERFDESIFSDDPIPPHGVSQRQMARKHRQTCEAYADSFPQPAARDLLFLGKSGLGKTFLLQAIARRVAQRGGSVRYISAYRLLEQARAAYFSNDRELLRPLMEAPLLLIDDLGTEPLMENITVTQLFNLLNERQNANRHTVISTNLSFTELRTRYTERISSRLMNSSDCKHLNFIGEDVRKRSRANGGDA